MEHVEGANEYALSQCVTNSDDSQFNGLSIGSPGNNINETDSGIGPESTGRGPYRNMLRKDPGGGDDDSLKGRKRFSKRHSKNGLAAVF